MRRRRPSFRRFTGFRLGVFSFQDDACDGWFRAQANSRLPRHSALLRCSWRATIAQRPRVCAEQPRARPRLCILRCDLHGTIATRAGVLVQQRCPWPASCILQRSARATTGQCATAHTWPLDPSRLVNIDDNFAISCAKRTQHPARGSMSSFRVPALPSP